MRIPMTLPLLLVVQLASAWQLPAAHAAGGRTRCATPLMEKGRESDDVAGAVGNTFGDIFASFFKPSAEKEAEIERAYQEQLEVAARRKDPIAYRKKIRETEERRERASKEFEENIAWQRGSNPLAAFKERQKAGKVNPIGYEDEPKGGIPFPSASFGVGGEFGVGGKYDNGMRFDLRLPFVDQGWVEDKGAKKKEQKPTRGKQPPGTQKATQKGTEAKAPTNPLEWWIQQTSKF